MTWPLPALVAWSLAWATYVTLGALLLPSWMALAAASSCGAALAVWGATPWRRVFIAASFPMSLLASGIAGSLPAWAWPLALLVLLYPLSSWRDAPLFPTPAGALAGLAALAPLPADRASLVDAGCGVDDGLHELHREYPQARIDGLEWSWPLRIVCAWRCRFAHVRRADIWTADWSGCGMVYLFQRPESMPRAVRKATRELGSGAWMASLESSKPHRLNRRTCCAAPTAAPPSGSCRGPAATGRNSPTRGSRDCADATCARLPRPLPVPAATASVRRSMHGRPATFPV